MKEDLKHIFMLVQAPAFWLTTMLSLIHIIVRALKVCLTLMQNRSAFLISLTIFARLKNMKFQAAPRFTVPSICLFQQLPAIQ